MQLSEIESVSDMGRKDSTDILTGEEGGNAQDIAVTDPVPGSLVLWSSGEQLQDTGKRLTVVTELTLREREKNANSHWWKPVSMFDGESEWAVS